MKRSFLSILFLVPTIVASAQSTIYVRNSTWQNFEVATQQSGTLTVPSTQWSQGDSIARGWIESTGQPVLTVNRTNAAVPLGDTAYYHIALNGTTDSLTIKVRVIGVANGTEMDYSVAGNGFSEPWFNDGNFHQVQTTLAGKPVIIKFKPDNDDASMSRNVRFAIHDLPVYELDEADFEDPNVLNIMYYNIQMISFGVSGMGQANERGALLPAQISPYQDVVCFAEAFDDTPRKDHLVPAMQAAGFPYRTEILNEPGGILPFPVNGGVIIFSRWPIEAEDEIKYAVCGQASQDCLANKGMKYARINKLGKRYHVFGTHMDAGGGSDDIYARRTQMAEIRAFITDLAIPQSEPVVFGGDFNTSPVRLNDDYQAFLDTINPIVPQYSGVYESNFSDEFGKIIDHAWGHRHYLVPTTITNEIMTLRSLHPTLWDISEFSDHRCVLARFAYPDFSKIGGDTLVCPGQDVTLSVNTTHAASYQWLKDNVPLNGETNAALELTNALQSQSGQYACLVSYDVLYGHWGDSLTALFYPNGSETVQAQLTFNFGNVVIDEALCQVGITDMQAANWHLFPNPTTGVLNISLPQNATTAPLRIYTPSGTLVASTVLNKRQSSINLSHLTAGVYLAEIDKDGSTYHQRFVVY